MGGLVRCQFCDQGLQLRERLTGELVLIQPKHQHVRRLVSLLEPLVGHSQLDAVELGLWQVDVEVTQCFGIFRVIVMEAERRDHRKAHAAPAFGRLIERAAEDTHSHDGQTIGIGVL